MVTIEFTEQGISISKRMLDALDFAYQRYLKNETPHIGVGVHFDGVSDWKVNTLDALKDRGLLKYMYVHDYDISDLGIAWMRDFYGVGFDLTDTTINDITVTQDMLEALMWLQGERLKNPNILHFPDFNIHLYDTWEKLADKGLIAIEFSDGCSFTAVGKQWVTDYVRLYLQDEHKKETVVEPRPNDKGLFNIENCIAGAKIKDLTPLEAFNLAAFAYGHNVSRFMLDKLVAKDVLHPKSRCVESKGLHIVGQVAQALTKYFGNHYPKVTPFQRQALNDLAFIYSITGMPISETHGAYTHLAKQGLVQKQYDDELQQNYWVITPKGLAFALTNSDQRQKAFGKSTYLMPIAKSGFTGMYQGDDNTAFLYDGRRVWVGRDDMVYAGNQSIYNLAMTLSQYTRSKNIVHLTVEQLFTDEHHVNKYSFYDDFAFQGTADVSIGYGTSQSVMNADIYRGVVISRRTPQGNSHAAVLSIVSPFDDMPFKDRHKQMNDYQRGILLDLISHMSKHAGWVTKWNVATPEIFNMIDINFVQQNRLNFDSIRVSDVGIAYVKQLAARVRWALIHGHWGWYDPDNETLEMVVEMRDNDNEIMIDVEHQDWYTMLWLHEIGLVTTVNRISEQVIDGGAADVFALTELGKRWLEENEY